MTVKFIICVFSTYLRTIWNYVLNVATAIVIVFVNYFLKLILKALSKFSRYYTVTSEISGTTIKLFFAMFVNTALITLVVRFLLSFCFLIIFFLNIYIF